MNQNHNTLNEWLQWLESLKIVRSSEKAFQRTKSVAQKLDVLKQTAKVITIGGTNGKGSTVAVLESIYSAAGYRVGSYTSPHLLSFNERIKIQGQPVADDILVDAFQKIEMARGETPLNYFQFATLAALLIFKQQPLDIILLEVGIGGRLDAVNIVEPDCSIVTSIGLDHCDVLGNTREEIAVEKAGIMRPYKPAICGDLEPPETFFEVVREVHAELFLQERDFDFKIQNNTWTWCQKHEGISTKIEHLPIPDIYLMNASTALMAIQALHIYLPVEEKAIQEGLKTTHLLGRCFKTSINGINILLDVAHNPAAAAMLLQEIQQLQCKGHIYAVVGMVRDKDILSTLKYFKSKVTQWFLASLPPPRGAVSSELASILQSLHIHKKNEFDNPVTALKQALEHSTSEDLILVFGSFLTVSEVIQSDFFECLYAQGKRI